MCHETKTTNQLYQKLSIVSIQGELNIDYVK